MSVSKKLYFGEHKTMTFTAAATNVYDRANIFYFDRNAHTRINQLPIMPTLGFNYTFRFIPKDCAYADASAMSLS
jgi:hypothetical protein